jgi:hypothetical protein
VVGGAALGAGLIHAAAVGPHAGHGVVPGLFAVAAVIGLASGVAVIVRPTRPVLVAVAALHVVMVATWVASRTTGVSFVSGLESREAVGYPDLVAAAFEVVVIGGSLALCRRPRTSRLPVSVAASTTVPVMLALALLAGPAVYVGATSTHDHGTEAASGHAHDHAAAHDHPASGTDTAAGHVHGSEAATVGTVGTAGGGHVHDHGAPSSARPFDPAKPLDLSGTPGVTEVQQKEAELLVARTLADLPAFADQAAAYAAGYRSIGDAGTGDEHYIKWDAINDPYVLDPEHPESLVYDTRTGIPRLEAAMFILPDGYTLDDVPAIGGGLVQWHIHDDLCFTTGPEPKVAGITSPGGPCTGGLEAFPPHPMIHVWIAPNPCGPFAALEGIGAGRTKDGTHACDHVHGSTGSTF